MKKTLAVLLALAMSCSMLAACGEEDDSSSKKDKDSSSVADSVADADSSEADASDADTSDVDSSEPESSEPESSEPESSEPESSEPESSEPDSSNVDGGDHKALKIINDITTTGEFTISISAEEDGETYSVYMTSNSEALYINMDMYGMSIAAYADSTGAYMLDEASKKYYMDPTGQGLGLSADDMLSEVADANMVFVEDTTVTVDGKDYSAEKYKNEDEGVEVIYVFDGDDIVYVGQEDQYIPVVFKATADTSKLSISGYTEMTDEEFATLFGY